MLKKVITIKKLLMNWLKINSFNKNKYSVIKI